MGHTVYRPAWLILCAVLLCAAGMGLATARDDNTNARRVSLAEARAQVVREQEELARRITSLEAINSPTEDQKTDLSWLLLARDYIQKSVTSVDRTLDFLQTIQAAPTQLRAIETALAAPIPEDAVDFDSTSPLDRVASELETRREKLEAARRTRAELEAETTRRYDRQNKISDEVATARRRLDEINDMLPVAAEISGQMRTDARTWALWAEQLYLRHFLDELDQESKSYDVRRELLRSRRQLAERELLIADQRFKHMEQLANRLRTEAGLEVMQAAGAASEAAANAHPLVREILFENQQLATEMADVLAISAQRSLDKQSLDARLNAVQRNFESTKEKVAQIGLTDAIGLKLRNDLNQLPDLRRFTVQLKHSREEINRVQLRRMELEDRLLGLVDLKRVARDRVENAGERIPDDQREQLIASVYETLTEQKERYLNELIRAYDILFEKYLYPMMEAERRFVEVVEQYKAFIDSRVLWIQSAPPLSLQDFGRGNRGLSWLAEGSSWQRVFDGVQSDVQQQPVTVIAPFVLVLMLFAGRGRFRKTLVQLGDAKTKADEGRIVDTLRALAVTVFLAAPWPVLIYVVAWHIKEAGEDPIFAGALSSGLTAVAELLFAGLLLRRLGERHGVGEGHFQWRRSSLDLVRKQLIRFLPFALPLVFVVAVVLEQPTQSYRDSLGRYAFVLLMIGVAGLVFRLLHPRRGLPRYYLETHAGSWVDRLSSIWFLGVLLVPAGLAFASAGGYAYTAVQLALYWKATFWLLLAVSIGRAMLLRWLNIEERKLAVEQWRKRMQSEEGGSIIAPGDAERHGTAEPELNLTHVSTQTVRLLNSVVLLTIAVGVVFIWSEVFPAFKLLNDVVLWSSSFVISQDGTDVTSYVPITLASVLTALLILGMTVFISRNIPGLLEIAILQRLPFTPSARYAVTTIVRYVLVIVGLALAFGAIGIGWSKLHWLIAAITVGLGFGLQEIFANFVSGIIILFEQPVRVGDAVTVGNISGKIARIQMRATTITDWDRKELIIPNKEFVTGQIVNWSLSDTILRIVISVGIAYGSDTQKANDILLDVAKTNSNVLQEPPPSAFFARFGESSLDFELRVFIPTPDVLLDTRHQLLMEIDRKFREAKIEIAFPQRDIHIRHIPKGAGGDVVLDSPS
ncbi:MAG: mechanosensitive ion channel [Pseudomonadota bacterium]|nr:mechanosensitive ion channel [Pseudomonadota bacterium]